MFTPIGFFGAAGAQVVTDSLEQWVDPLVSSTVDQSGNGRNVTLNGGLSTSGGVYILDGSSKYINGGWGQTLTTTWTWCGWFKVNAGGIGTAPTNIITNYITSTTPFFSMHVYGSSHPTRPGGVFFHGRTTGGNEIPEREIEVNDMRGDGWHYWCCAYNGATGAYYGWKDGSLVNSGTDAGETGNYTSGQNLAIYGGHLARFFSDAEGGPFQIYSKKLSDDEVLQNFDADKSRFGL